MTTENWIDLPTMQDVAKAQSEWWEIEYTYPGSAWNQWLGTGWSRSSNYRGRPRQPKTKTITLRRAVLFSYDGQYVSYDVEPPIEGDPRFRCWIGDPFTVEVPA